MLRDENRRVTKGGGLCTSTLRECGGERPITFETIRSAKVVCTSTLRECGGGERPITFETDDSRLCVPVHYVNVVVVRGP